MASRVRDKTIIFIGVKTRRMHSCVIATDQPAPSYSGYQGCLRSASPPSRCLLHFVSLPELGMPYQNLLCEVWAEFGQRPRPRTHSDLTVCRESYTVTSTHVTDKPLRLGSTIPLLSCHYWTGLWGELLPGVQYRSTMSSGRRITRKILYSSL